MIEVTINGQKEKIAVGTTVADILQAKEVRPEMVAVEINGQLIQRNEYRTLTLVVGDQMEFLYYMAGGDFGRQNRRQSNRATESGTTEIRLNDRDFNHN